MTMLTSSFCSRININSRIHKRWRLKTKIYDDVTRWDPANYQWSYNLYKLPFFVHMMNISWSVYGVFIQYHANELLTPPFWSHLIASFVKQLKWFNKQIGHQYHSICLPWLSVVELWFQLVFGDWESRCKIWGRWHMYTFYFKTI